MRRLFLIAGLMTALGLAVVAASAFAPANFAGNWSLDKAKSQNLSQRMQSAESVTWTITQDGKTISIDSKVVAGAPPAGGGGGGGGGMGGGGQRGGGPAGPQVYNLDGNESTSDVTMGQGTGKATTKATWSNNGATLELSRKTTFQGQNGEVTQSNNQKLSLSGDGKVLTVAQHSEGPRGPQDSTMVFNKQ
jgi:hypothetical protein